MIKNAFYLMFSTFILGISGFIFWVFVTRGYDTSAVGLATTLLSVSGLLSLLGLAGFDTTFVRFLPKLHRKNDYINTGLIVATIVSVLLATGLAMIIPLFSPGLAILNQPWVFASFVFFTVVTALNILTNAVFLAFKETRYVLIINALFSGFKIALPLLISGGGAVTIFVLSGAAQLFGLILSIFWMQRRFGYKFAPIIHMDTLRVVKKFSFSIYASNILSLLPPTLLPLIILHHIGAKNAAYYYVAFTIASVLHTVVYASMQSVLAEGSHNESALRFHVTSAAKFIAILLLPATLLVVFLSRVLLAVFGTEYADAASTLLRLLAIGVVPIAAYAALTTIFKITKQLAPVIYMNTVSAAIVLGLSGWFTPRFGLDSVGWFWLIGNTTACCIGVFFLNQHKKQRRK